uniref:NAD(P)-binding domain-containing protein n=1 Tax=Physcomitrium patens TaxID=3218 RepID=A0A7I4F633_PHYPA
MYLSSHDTLVSTPLATVLDLQSGKCVRRARRGCSSVGVKVQSVHNGFRVNASTRPEDSKDNNEASKNEPEEMETIQRLKAEDSGKDDADQVTITLDDVNPVRLGRRTRQVFDDAWRRLTKLGLLTSASRPSDEYDFETVVVGGPMCDFQTPNAELTTVLIAGATGRVGRILIRKLQLRGYKVKALVRQNDEQTLEKIPRSVQIVVGDVGDPTTMKEAVEGCNKIVFCAGARSSITGDLSRVDHQGVYNLSKAFQDYNHKLAQTRAGRSSKSKLTIAKFSQATASEGWELREGFYFTDDVAGKYDGGMDAQFEVGEDGNAVFTGYVFTRGGYVELAKRISLPPGLTLDRYEVLVLSVCGDGKSYTLLVETDPSEDDPKCRQYFSRFPTRLGYSRVRIPFSSFRPMDPESPPLDPFLVHSLMFRFEPRRQKSSANRPASTLPPAQENQHNSFRLVLDYIKALPGGQETDFILVSCSGAGVPNEMREKVLRAKQAGEAALRNSGLGYTIIRPGPLQEEAGGQKALVFDQGDRITQSISCADVADVCVKALHNPTARNKSFDVCYEYTAEEGLGLYELVAHLPDKSNNYLTPALAVLETNT